MVGKIKTLRASQLIKIRASIRKEWKSTYNFDLSDTNKYMLKSLEIDDIDFDKQYQASCEKVWLLDDLIKLCKIEQ